MARFLVDEDLPRALAPALREAGLDARDVREEGLRGQPDANIFSFAVERGFVIVTADVEFGTSRRLTSRTRSSTRANITRSRRRVEVAGRGGREPSDESF